MTQAEFRLALQAAFTAGFLRANESGDAAHNELVQELAKEAWQEYLRASVRELEGEFARFTHFVPSNWS